MTAPALSGTGRFLLFTSTGPNFVSDDTNGADVFVADRDQDNDGMFSTWEILFGLDPANGADGALDSGRRRIDGRAGIRHGRPSGRDVQYYSRKARKTAS